METVLLNASVGFQRVLGRLRRPKHHRLASTRTQGSPRPAVGRTVRRGLHSVVAASRLVPQRHPRTTVSPPVELRRRSFISRLGPDRAVAAAVVAVLLGASVLSFSAGRPVAATGGTTGDGSAPRIAVGGDVQSQDGSPVDGTGDVQFAQPDVPEPPAGDFAAIDVGADQVEPEVPVAVEGPFIDDGTLVKPIAVDTTVPDGSALVKTYKVKPGDTVAAIAAKFHVSTMSVAWANDLKSKTDIHTGQTLSIPPVTGLIVTVTPTDTLDSLAARYGVNGTDILATNGLDDPNLVVGQVLVVPGASGAPMATPKPPTTRTARPATNTGRPPTTYRGGKFLWPVVGGGNYISQYFHYGHYAIDIAADYGSTVRAAAAGTVTFAGWKDNGGGYQVWIAHGSGLYTTYNHMSAISVGLGQRVSRGQQVGRIGMTGNATGPHLHFEVWIGPVWDGGRRVNPLGYL
jgi:murein DD-endopeptidase MepM/ murein hydrolase activator NlpD